MNRYELGALGLALAQDLFAESYKYHVKSDARDVLIYESIAMQEMSEALLNELSTELMLRDSTLLSEWGVVFSEGIPELSSRVRQFRYLHENVGGE